MKIPASYHQERLWYTDKFESLLHGSSPTYHNVPVILEISGDIDAGLLEMSIHEVIRRHEALRTRVYSAEDELFQKVGKDVDFPLTVIDLRKDRQIKTYEQAVNLVVKEADLPFTLDKDLLIKGKLFHIEKEKFILVIILHHIIADRYSIKILVEEMLFCYEKYSQKQNAGLQDLQLHYIDFSNWQKQLPQKYYEYLSAYWKMKLEGKLHAFKLPADKPDASIHPYQSSRESFTLSKDLYEKIVLYSKQKNIKIFTTLLGVFKVLLLKYSGHEEILIGTSAANRLQQETAGVIGPIANLLLLRSFLPVNYSFDRFVCDLKETLDEAFQYQGMPFDKLVSVLEPAIDRSRPVLFNVVFQYEEAPIRISPTAGLEISTIETNLGWGKYDINILIQKQEDSFTGVIVYNSSNYNNSTITRFIGRYKRLLASIIENPGLPVSELSLLTVEEKNRILNVFNNTKTGSPEDRLIHGLFEEQVKRNPENIAFISEDNHMTYMEINRRANRLARFLRNNGVTANMIVGIMLAESIDMIIGILGILKAGGAYLPIGPGYSEKRIVRMLEESNTELVLLNNAANKRYYLRSSPGVRKLPAKKLEPFKTAPRPQIKNLDDLSFPYRSLIDYEKYNKYIGQAMVKHSITFQGTRGCPYNCAYCHKIWPKKHVARSAENIFAEMKLFYDIGVKRFVFIDDIFNFDIKNSTGFFELILANNLDIQLFFPSGMRGDILTTDYIDLMVESGLSGLALALETPSKRLQKLIGKNLNVEKLRENIEYICKKYPHVIFELFVMHGFPTETEEEALMTLDFIKSIKWIHFPYINILRIFPGTQMEKIALENGISRQAILNQVELTQNDAADTLPFDKKFTQKFQADYLKDYFFSKERLLSVLPSQMKALTEDEIIQKYNSYLPVEIKNFNDILGLVGIKREQLAVEAFLKEESVFVLELNKKLKEIFPGKIPYKNALKILLLDVSQGFRKETHVVYDTVEPPLGLMYLMANLYNRFGNKIAGKIAKSRFDFDSLEELTELIDEFEPDIIGIRSLSIYKKLFHKTTSHIKSWLGDVPIIAGGPYTTSDYVSVLQDRHVDLVVLGEGEVTFIEIVGKILENDGKLPAEDVLEKIKGIAYIPEKEKGIQHPSRRIFLLDELKEQTLQEPDQDLTHINRPGDISAVMYTPGTATEAKGVVIEHRNVVRLLFAGKNDFDVKSSDTWKMLYSFCSGSSVSDIFGPLLNGRKLNVIPRIISGDTGKFSEVLEMGSDNIGKPVPALRAYVMDKNLKLLPLGVPGELLIDGEGLCRGYLGLPDLTAEKFVDNPLKKNERLYRSGYQVRLLDNGDFEYLGSLTP